MVNKSENLTCPFWSWSGEINKREIKKQLSYFKEMGYGGFFIHPRTGLETEYLSKKWFELVNYCIKESAKLGLKVFLYDEDRYPSGTCGGVVTKDLRFVRKHLYMTIADEFIGELYDSVVGVFSVDFDGEYLRSYKKYDGESGKKAIFYLEYAKPSSYFNGQPYLDTISKEAIEAFLNSTHEKYKKNCGEYFGTDVLGIFSDEVGYGHLFCAEQKNNVIENKQVPYSNGLFIEFFNKYGYRIEDRLPELFFRKKGETVRKIAWQYVNLLQEKFLDNFAKPYSDWCKNNGIAFTGHILQEETLSTQTVCCGSAMRFYQYMDLPGIDVLMEEPKNEWIIKQVVSVKKQLGKAHAIAECYGATGYNITLERYKKMSDVLSVFGITLKVPHLAPYTMKGRAKRDYPGNLFCQNSGYQYTSILENYHDNLSQYLLSGEDTTDVCVIHPIETVWAMAYYDAFEDLSFGAKDKSIKSFEKEFTDTFYALLDANIDFDYADEGIIDKHCKVIKEDGKAKFVVGGKKYSTVILYENKIIRKSTFDRLREFVSIGGRAFLNNQKLMFVDFEDVKSFDFGGFIKVNNLSDLINGVKNSLAFRVDSDKNVVLNVRKVDGGYYLFAVNSKRTQPLNSVKISVDGDFCVCEVELLSNEYMSVESEKTVDKTVIETSFGGGQAKLFYFSKEPQATKQCALKKVKKVDLPKEFSYRLSEENLLLIDNAKYYVDGKFTGEDYTRTVDKDLRNYFFLEQKKEMMCQPYYKKKYERDYDKKLCRLDLEYSFLCGDYIPKKLYLAIEQSEEFIVKINGKLLEKANCGFWIDNCFSKIEIPTDFINSGKNVITLSCDYKDCINVENVYVLGYFGVDKDLKTIVRLPNKLSVGDVAKQGLPFYRGKIVYVASVAAKNAVVCFNKNNGYAQSVISDGVFYPANFYPYQTKILGEVKSLEFEICISGHNAFGPVHNKDEDLQWVGPFAYEDFKTGNFDSGYLLKEQGLINLPEVFESVE